MAQSTLATQVTSLIAVLYGIIDSTPTVNGQGVAIPDATINTYITGLVMAFASQVDLSATGLSSSQFQGAINQVVGLVRTFKATNGI